MKKLLTVTIILLLTIAIFTVIVRPVSSTTQFDEYLDVWSYGTASLFNLRIADHPAVTKGLKEILNFVPQNSSITITYYNVPSWRPYYNYLLSGVVYNYTPWKETPWTHMVIQSNNSVSGDVKSNLQKIFKTYFVYVNDKTLFGYTDYDIFKDFLNDVFSLPDYTRFLLWMRPDEFSSEDIFSISLKLNGSSSMLNITILRDNKVKYFYWSVGKFLHFRESVPKIKYNYTSHLQVFFKDVFIEELPKNISSYTIENTTRLYIYRFDIPSEKDFKDVKFKIRYETPAILITRRFNSTDFINGSTIEVRLDVMNLMPYPLYNITVKEYNWLIDGIKLIEGSLEKNITELKASSIDTLIYKVKINTSKIEAVYIGPAIATLRSRTGYVENISSNTNVIYLNDPDAPFIQARIEDIKSDYTVKGKIKYVASVENIGSSDVNSLVFGEYIVGELKPGEARKVEGSISVNEVGSRVINLVLPVSYVYNNTIYNMSTQNLSLYLYPNDLIYPYLEVSFRYNKLNDTALNMTIDLSNKGLYDVYNINISFIGLGSNIPTPVSGDLVNSSYYKDILLINHTLSISTLFKYPTRTISPYPFIVIKYKDALSPIHSGFKYFYNTVNISRICPKQPYLSNYNYTLKIVVNNYGEVSIYNLTLTSVIGDVHVTPHKINYTLIPPHKSHMFNFTFYTDKVGNFSIPNIKYSYWYLGSYHEGGVGILNVSFYKGVWLDVKYPSSIDEKESFNLTINIFSDRPELIERATLNIELPTGLVFENGAQNLSMDIYVNKSESRLQYKIYPKAPGEYTIKNISIAYVFNGIPVHYSIPQDKLPKVSVRENVIMRYWIYFLPMVAVAVLYSYYLRKIVYKE